MRKSLIYARRLVGDIGPLNTDPVRRLPGRVIAPAESITGYYQDYDVASDTQHYRIGSRMQVDERVFYYGSAGNTLIPDVGAKNAYTQCVGFAALPTVLTLAASYTLIVTVAGTDGIAGNGNIGLNELRNGWIVIFMPNAAINRRVVGNTLVAGGGPMTVTMDRPLGVDVPNTEHAEIMHSPYKSVIQSVNDIYSVVGMAPVAATVGQFVWLQTWGPVWAAAQGVVGVGANKKVVFRNDGSLDEFDPADIATYHAQTAGYVLCPSRTGGQGAPFFQLQLAP